MATFQIPTAYTDELIDREFAGDMTAFNAVLRAALEAEGDGMTPKARGPLTSWIGYVFGNPRMTKVQALALLPFGPGDPSPFFLAMDSETQEGAILERGTTPESLARMNVRRPGWLSFGRVVMVVAAGGEVTGHSLWLMIDESAIDTEIPNGVPFATIEDNGTERPRTWREWPRAIHAEADSNNELTGRSVIEASDGNSHFPGSLVVALAQNTGVNATVKPVLYQAEIEG